MDYSNGDWTSTDDAWENSPHPSPSRKEYGNNEKPGSFHLHPSHISPAYLTSEAPSLRPRGILTVDLHPFHHEPSFIAPPHQGNRPVGHPSPTSRHISAQATLYPMMSCAPSILPPASFCTPPPHHPGCSPAPFGYLPYDPRLFLSSLPPTGVDIQPVAVSMVNPESYVPYIIPAPIPERISDAPLNLYPPRQPTPPRSTWPCPLCDKPFGRPQDRRRHLPVHLPYWISCSYDDCSWRGYRIDIFKKHWYNEHQPTNPPDESGSKLYDPMPLVDGIVGGSVSIEDATNWAVERINRIAVTLDKEVLLTDPWGWKEKDSRQYSRFVRTNTLRNISSSIPAFSSVPPAELWESAPVVHKHPTLMPKTDRYFDFDDSITIPT